MNSRSYRPSERNRKYASLIMMLGIVFACQLSVKAQDFTWGPTPISQDWHSAVNWSGGSGSNPIPDSTSDTATISSTSINPRLFISATIGDLTIENGASLNAQTNNLSVLIGSGTTGNTQIEAGATLFASTDANILTSSLNGAGNIQLNSPTSKLTVGLHGLTGGSGLFSGSISGSGALTKTGSGTFTLAASSPYLGDTMISQGTLKLLNLGRLGNFSSVTVAQGATFEVDISSADAIWGLNGSGNVVIADGSHLVVGNFDNNGGIGDFAGSIQGPGKFEKRGPGTQVLRAINSYAGDTQVSEGTLQVLGSGRLRNLSAVTVDSGATFELDINSADAIWGLNGFGDVVIADGSTLVVGNFEGFEGHQGGIGDFAGSILGAGKFEKRGLGTQILRAINPYTGETEVSEGTLKVLNGGRLQDISAVTVDAGATFELDIQSADAIWGINGSGNVVIAEGSNLVVGNWGNDGGIGSFSGNIQGQGDFSKRGLGTQTLNSGNTYSGLTTVSEGILRAINSSGSATGTGDVIVETNGMLRIDGGSISTPSLTIDGTANMTSGSLDAELFDFDNGFFSMSGGRLVADMVVGDLSLGGGTLAIGDSPGLMMIEGNFSSTVGTTMEIEIGGLDAGSQYDQLVVTGDVSLAGSLELELIDSFLPQSGQEFSIITATGNVTGAFAGLADGDLVGTYSGVSLYINYDNDCVSLFAIGGGVLLGDVNLDGSVNLLDVDPFIELLGTGAFQAEADINEDGVVNLLDVDPFIGLLAGN